MSWYILRRGRPEGPFAEQAFSDLLTQGRIGPRDLVWRAGFDAWVPLLEASSASIGHWSGPQTPPPPPAMHPAGAGTGRSAGPLTLLLLLAVILAGAGGFLATRLIADDPRPVTRESIPAPSEPSPERSDRVAPPAPAANRNPASAPSITVSADGQTLTYSGGFTPGATARLREAFERAQNARILRLESGGGLVAEGLSMAKMIDDFGLRTRVESYCASACVFAFAAGVERTIGRRAVIGLHQTRAEGRQRHELEPMEEKLKAILADRNIGYALILKGFETPHDQLYTPTHDELFRWRLATGYAD